MSAPFTAYHLEHAIAGWSDSAIRSFVVWLFKRGCFNRHDVLDYLRHHSKDA